jgi:hypothetical protein
MRDRVLYSIKVEQKTANVGSPGTAIRAQHIRVFSRPVLAGLYLLSDLCCFS